MQLTRKRECPKCGTLSLGSFDVAPASRRVMPAPRPKELRPVVVMLDEASYQWLMDRTSQMTGYSKVLRDLIHAERFKKGF